MRRLCTAAIAAFLMTVMVSTQTQARLISQQQELSMGKQGAQQIEATYPVSKDSNAINMVVDMGNRIAAKSTRPDLAWQFKVLETKEVNAVSVPGYVYVNRGLLTFVGKDKDALAGVIAHEIGHTAARHTVKSVEQQMKYGLAIQLLLGKNANTQQLGSLAANLALLGYSRKDEYEADRLGVDFMTKANYNPNGMLRFFRALQQKEGKDPGGLTVYFKTHPPTKDRITRVQKEMQKVGVKPTGGMLLAGG